MKTIFCIGETVLDIIFQDNRPVAATPGGSMLNTAVSLGRAAMNPVFISDIGQDAAGDLVAAFLAGNGVNDRFVERFTNGQTAISLAFLDDQRNAHYSFYRNFPEKRLRQPFPEPGPGDIVMFGSFYAITHEVRQPLWDFLLKAKINGAFLVYDPNFRKPHLKELPKFRPWILENISIAHVTRGSAGDFMHIFELDDVQNVYREIRAHGGDTLIYTKSKEGVEVITPDLHLNMEVPVICPVSTIGAGDAFNAGLIYSFAALPGRNVLPLSKQEWHRVIQLAIGFSTDVCMSLDNYISYDFASQLSHD